MNTGTLAQPVKVPIVEQGATIDYAYTKWIYDYIARQVGYYKKLSQKLLKEKDRSIEEVTVVLPNSSLQQFFFDVTENVKSLEREFKLGLSQSDES